MDELTRIPPRAATAHKGDFGRVLIVAGSVGMHGAAVLAASAALRSGAGLVTVALPRSAYPVAGPAECRATWLPLAETETGGLALEALEPLENATHDATVVALGPGLGRHPATVELVGDLAPRIRQPLVVDADGLNAFADCPERLAVREAVTVLTPHPGELRRLIPSNPEDDDASRARAARELALRARSIVVLKGHRSVVTDATSTFFNTTGNPGMASGGAGDVLTGCLAALLAVIDDPLAGTRLAVHVHGAAGDRAAARLGVTAVTASDLIDELAPVLESFVAEGPGAP